MTDFVQLASIQQAPYGLWNSPITAAMTTRNEKSGRNCNIVISKESIYWTESRPHEAGRTVILQCKPDGQVSVITPTGFDVRSKVHEYGGLAFTVIGDTVYFVNAKDQRLYVQPPNQTPKALTPIGLRYADLHPSPKGIFAVAEEHVNKKVNNFLVLIDTETGSHAILDQEHDFYAAPTLSPNGKSLAWLTWDHPNMPWDGTELWTAQMDSSGLINKVKKAGGNSESIFQPRWSPQGNLFFISDCTGWWNFYMLKNGEMLPLYPKKAEFGLPLWSLGTSTWGFTGRGEEIVCAYQEKGIGKLALLDPATKQLHPLPFPFSDYAQIATGKNRIVCLMGTPTRPRQLMEISLPSLNLKEIAPSDPLPLDPGYLTNPEPIEYPSAHQRVSYGYFYPPKNKDYVGLCGTLPPLIIMSHGGPTAAADPIFNLRIQYWTSRGFAVLDVNYAGSTGYGRQYRDSLKGLWGIADVEDCIAGTYFLINQKKVDSKRIFIRGGSAGGYTTLAALAHSSIFAGGASYYGVADLELLLNDTHKFEAHYLDSLIGPFPEKKNLYKERSPLFHAEHISSPVIFFQGGKDLIVPPQQTKMMFEALKKKGIPTQLIIYEEEEHGFRQAANIQDSLEKELQFYLKISPK